LIQLSKINKIMKMKFKNKFQKNKQKYYKLVNRIIYLNKRKGKKALNQKTLY